MRKIYVTFDTYPTKPAVQSAAVAAGATEVVHCPGGVILRPLAALGISTEGYYEIPDIVDVDGQRVARVKATLVDGAKQILAQVAAARTQLATIQAGPASPTAAQLATALKQVAAIEDTLVVCVDRLIRLTLADVAPELLVEGTP